METYALKVRIMLAHRRDRQSSKPPPVCSDSHKDPSPKRLRRTNAQYFRFEEDDEQFEPTVDTRYFTGKALEAMEILSNGIENKADRYIQGPEGFAVAKFRCHEMVLEVPASCASPDGRLVQHQPKAAAKSKCKSKAKAAATSKKPAAASTDGDVESDHGVSEKEADEENEEDEDLYSPYLQRAGGHNN